MAKKRVEVLQLEDGISLANVSPAGSAGGGVPLRVRRQYGRIRNHLAPPPLIMVQVDSFDWFRQHGLTELFREISPIVSFNKNLELHFVGHRFDEPKYGVVDCREMDMTYSAPLWVTVRLINRSTGEIQEQEVFMGDFPMMTYNGTFVINGAERVVVSQLIRSPGVYFSADKDSTTGRSLASAKLIPNRGAWLEFETSKRDVVSVKIDRKRKFPVTSLLRAVGFGNNEELLALFSAVDDSEDHPFISTTLEKDPTTDEEDAVLDIFRKLRPGDPPTIDNARTFLSSMLFNERRYDLGRVGRYKLDRKLHIRPGQKRAVPLDEPRPLTLTRDDLRAVVAHMLEINNEREHPDDIDHLGNRRVKTVGELIQNQLRVGLLRMERVVRERMSTRDPDQVTPLGLINIRPVVAATREFFGGSQLSQFMDQTNPLGELTHKRRLSALGPGGLRRERAGFDVRDVHHSHYGRICPIETPEGPNIGLIGSLATYARVNDYGFIETPYRRVRNMVAGTEEGLLGRALREDVADKSGKVVGAAGKRIDKALAAKLAALDLAEIPVVPFVIESEEVEYLTADVEDHYSVAQANSPLNDEGEFVEAQVTVRREDRFLLRRPENVDYMDVDPKQIVSVSTSLIPFLEHDDANRALMGSNMLRQGVPLVKPEAPIVGTGMEGPVAINSGHVAVTEAAGEVISVTGDRILVRELGGGIRVYNLTKFMRSNASTTIDQRPIVHQGDLVQAGDVLADSSSTEKGELALGQNVRVAFLSWEGGNYEDAILISEDVVRQDKFTSIHVEKHEIEARDTKLGPEEITRDIPNVGDEALKDLDEEGVIRVGAEVQPGDILVGKITPKGETDLTPEEKLLRAIFGEKAREVKDSSLRLPHGERGKVVSIRSFDRDDAIELSAGVERLVRVSVAQRRKVNEGDKMAGRHGNKGVISQVVPLEDMPFLEDGTPIEIMLNPLGVPGRMNIGQILETHLGWAADRLGFSVMTSVFDGARESDISAELARAWLIDTAWREVTDRAFAWLDAEGDPAASFADDDEVRALFLDSWLPDADRDRLWSDTPYARRAALAQWLVAEGYDPASMLRYEDDTDQGDLRESANYAAIDACLRLWVVRALAERDEKPSFDVAKAGGEGLLAEVRAVATRLHLPLPIAGKQRLFDGKSGEPYDEAVTVGIIYMMKLAHLVEDKVHARSTGPYSLVTQQPLGGKAQFGGQRFGEMEVWALEAYGAAHTLQEMLTIKSDDVTGRVKTYEAIVKGEEIQDPGAPESFRVLVKELQSLGLSVKVLDSEGDEISLGREHEDDRGPRLGIGLRLPPNRRAADVGED